MARVATLWPGGIRPLMVTFSAWVPPTSCERAMRTSSAGWRRMNGVMNTSVTFRGPPRIRLCRAAGGAPLRGRRRRRFGGGSVEHLGEPQDQLREVGDDQQRPQQRYQPRQDGHRGSLD